MSFLIVLAILSLVVIVVTWPLLRGRAELDAPEQASGEASSVELAELEAAREAKYREIRDAELDHRTGKLSDADFEAIDSSLRAEAVQILHEIDRVSGTSAVADSSPDSESNGYHRAG